MAISDYQADVMRDSLDEVIKDLNDNDNILTLAHIGKVFGDEFWIMIVMALMDAQDAARAIQGAIARLSASDEAKNDETILQG